MSGKIFNLLTDALITAAPLGALTLPGTLAALARDEVDDFPALRAHQGMFWHMFLVQLAALALHGAGETEIPQDEETWRRLLRGLTKDFPDDEPWCLVVDDWSKPAFMQAAVPDEVRLEKPAPSPDALDLLITAKNHDLKQAVARQAEPEDWLFALVTLQTGEGYNGRDNYGIARMNGGSSSRPMLGLAPLSSRTPMNMAPRPGAWFSRDVAVLLTTRQRVLDKSVIDYPPVGGVGLTWLAPWPEGAQLRTRDLDVWFIEVCRRVRLSIREHGLFGSTGTSKATRIDAKHLNGALDDPWAPVLRAENKSLTLSSGDFDYRRLTELLFSGDWDRPVLPELADIDRQGETLAVVAAALSRGNSKTEGFKSRVVPLSGKVARALGARRPELHQLARSQVESIVTFDKALRDALVLAAAGGEREEQEGKKKKKKEKLYKYAELAHTHLDRYADEIFFEHLWRRFEALEAGPEALQAEEKAFAEKLWSRAQMIFEQALPALPCPSLFRPRAEARARSLLRFLVKKRYPELFPMQQQMEAMTDAA